jgi:hypothetical protein
VYEKIDLAPGLDAAVVGTDRARIIDEPLQSSSLRRRLAWRIR